MTKTLIALSLVLLAVTAQAKGSSHPAESAPIPGGMVPIELAQRLIRYTHDRLKQSADGDILTCPVWHETEYIRGGGYKCLDPKSGADRWIPLSQVALPGYEQSGVQVAFFGSSGSMTLVVYFRKKQ